MDANAAIDLARQAMMLTLILAAPVLATALIVAAVVGVLQAATQVQEQTLSFVPKILAVVIAGLMLGPWMLTRLIEFSRQMFGQVP
ncbi:MAG: flagellar biosynthesis protein FliQ [Phycisphaerae bacterium]|jgi:flagellar biosynthetic protein FliQ